jgi:hypothetical protein
LFIDTGLKTLASSSEGREAGGGPSASGVRSACSMRVKSPCPAAAAGGAGAGGGGAGGAAAGVGECAITSAAEVENIPEAEDAGGVLGGANAGAAGAGVGADAAGPAFRAWNIAVNPLDWLAAGAGGAAGAGV